MAVRTVEAQKQAQKLAEEAAKDPTSVKEGASAFFQHFKEHVARDLGFADPPSATGKGDGRMKSDSGSQKLK